MQAADLAVIYSSREVVHEATDAALLRDFVIALSYPEHTTISLYVVTWMISEIQVRDLDPRVEESSPAW